MRTVPYLGENLGAVYEDCTLSGCESGDCVRGLYLIWVRIWELCMRTVPYLGVNLGAVYEDCTLSG